MVQYSPTGRSKTFKDFNILILISLADDAGNINLVGYSVKIELS